MLHPIKNWARSLTITLATVDPDYNQKTCIYLTNNQNFALHLKAAATLHSFTSAMYVYIWPTILCHLHFSTF